MSMGLVLLIFDQGPNPGPSSDRYYLFANFASSNFHYTVSSVFYLNLVNQLNFVDEYRSSHLRYTAHETCTHQQKSTVSSCFSDKFRRTSYNQLTKYDHITSRAAAALPRLSCALLCCQSGCWDSVNLFQNLENLLRAARSCPVAAAALLLLFSTRLYLARYLFISDIKSCNGRQWCHDMSLVREAMSQHVTCHVHMFVSIGPVELRCDVCTGPGSGTDWAESSGAATVSAAAPTTDSTAAVSTALTAAQPSLHTLQKIRFIIHTIRPLVIFSSCSF